MPKLHQYLVQNSRVLQHSHPQEFVQRPQRGPLQVRPQLQTRVAAGINHAQIKRTRTQDCSLMELLAD